MTDAFKFPEFFDYPPYFTVQPNPDTQRKQTELWKSLILGWCQHHRSFVLRLDDETLDLWRNDVVRRRLNSAARKKFVDALAKDGKAVWANDPSSSSRAVIFWKPLDAWCDDLVDWAIENGLEGSIVTVDEVVGGGGRSGGSKSFEGAPTEFVQVVANELERREKGAFIPKQGEDDAGIKFF